MTCRNATAPININNNVDALCDLKCDYGYSYPFSSVSVTNRGTYLSFRIDQASVPPVVYNAANYRVDEVRIYTPSLHTYSGVRADAEMIIIHNAISVQGTLLVCIPLLVVENAASDSVTLLNSLLAEVSRTANVPGQQTIVNLATFNLNQFIPNKPFYSYMGTLPFPPCTDTVNYVVFSTTNDGQKTISKDAFETLNNVIASHDYVVSSKNQNGLFYNKNGPKMTTDVKADGIYIDCKPTGADGEVIVPNDKTSAQIFRLTGLKALLQNVLFQAVIGLILIWALMKLGNVLLLRLSAKEGQPELKPMFGGAAKAVLRRLR
jgi:carbonic anhydrase